MNNKLRVFLDFDGVICAFTKSACRVMGEPYPSNYTFHNYSWLFDKKGRQNCYKAMRGHDFWSTMELFPWAKDMVDIVNKTTNGNWYFLTKSMSNDHQCLSGKSEWLHKHFPNYTDRLCVLSGGCKKSIFVRGKKDVLIDDCLYNCHDWRNNGGSIYFWEEVSMDYNKLLIDKRLEHLSSFLKNLS